MRVTFFSPHAGIQLHAIPERKLIESYIHRGHDVTVVTCSGELSAPCITMNSRNLDLSSSRFSMAMTCMTCRRLSSQLYSDRDKLTVVKMESLISQEDFGLIDALCANVTQSNWRSFKYRDISIGILASYEILLKYKLNSLIFNEEQFEELLAKIRLTLVSLMAAESHFRKSNPQLVVAYNMLYSVNRVWKIVAESSGASSYSIQLGWDAAARTDTLMIYRDENDQFLLAGSPEADLALDSPISPEGIKRVKDHLLALSSSSDVFVYSKQHEQIHPKATREKFDIDPNKPVILIPLSSEDERFAAGVLGIEFMKRKSQLFEDQTSWINYLIKFAEQNDQWQFIFRLHPRMFPNRREGYEASAAAEFLTLFATLPSNVRLNVPSDECSLSDLLQITHLVLAGKSTVGAQCAAYGMPIVLHDIETLNAFSPRLGRVVKDLNSLVNIIDSALSEGLKFETSRQAFRWFDYLNSRVAFQFSLQRDSPKYFVERATVNTGTWRIQQRFLPQLKKKLSGGLISSILRYPLLRRASHRAMKNLGSDSLPLDPLVLVSEMGLKGLQEVRLTEGMPNDSTETNSLKTALEDIAHVLGKFNDDSDCLTSRMAKMIANS